MKQTQCCLQFFNNCCSSFYCNGLLCHCYNLVWIGVTKLQLENLHCTDKVSDEAAILSMFLLSSLSLPLSRRRAEEPHWGHLGLTRGKETNVPLTHVVLGQPLWPHSIQGGAFRCHCTAGCRVTIGLGC